VGPQLPGDVVVRHHGQSGHGRTLTSGLRGRSVHTPVTRGLIPLRACNIPRGPAKPRPHRLRVITWAPP
jgi:hypothetical protein